MVNKPKESELTFNRKKIIRFFFFGAFALILYQMFYLAQPFLTALLLAGMLAMAFFPAFLWLKRNLGAPNLAALIMTLCVFLAAVIPLVGTAWFVFKEADRLLPTAQAFSSNIQNLELSTVQARVPGFLKPLFDPLFHFFETMDINPQVKIPQYAALIGAKISALGSFAARHIFFAFINGIVLLVSLFFTFRDGEALYQWVLGLIPMEEDHKKAIARRTYETFMAVVIGGIMTAFAQGFVAMIGFLIAGVKLPVLLGLATVMVAFLGASFLVTVPVAIAMFQDSTGWGIFLLIWAVVAVGLLDNILKPILIGTRARMPFVLIFFSIIGGIKAYGILGFILGPIILASFLTFVNIYRKGYNTRTAEEEITPS
jgi:predicted PurR-regulated permease PerM